MLALALSRARWRPHRELAALPDFIITDPDVGKSVARAFFEPPR